MGSSTWKTRDETFHGSKWGFVVVALIIAVVISLLGGIFYLIGEGMKSVDLNPETIFSFSALTIAIILIIVFAAILLAKAGIFAISAVSAVFSPFYSALSTIWGFIWTIFANVYILILTIVLIAIILTSIATAVSFDIDISFNNPIIIALLIVLLILFFPFAIFIIDLFSYEHE